MLTKLFFRFWVQIIYDNETIETIISFLQETTPSYIPLRSLTSDTKVIELYSSILKNILTVICRIITNKENDFEWLEKSFLADILYSKYIISVPIMFDLIPSYGRANVTLLKRIFDTILKIEPKYETDLKLGLKYIQITLKKVFDEIKHDSNLSLLEDVALHSLDCVYTLNVLLEVCPITKSICADVKMEQNLSEFYENIVPKLYEKIYFMDQNSIGLKYLNYSRMELLGAFQNMLSLHMDNALNNP